MIICLSSMLKLFANITTKTNTLQIYFSSVLPFKILVIRKLTVILTKKFNNVAVLLHPNNQYVKQKIQGYRFSRYPCNTMNKKQFILLLLCRLQLLDIQSLQAVLSVCRTWRHLFSRRCLCAGFGTNNCSIFRAGQP